jgi:proteasome accessory factor A
MSERLIGIETEFALFWVPAVPGAAGPTHREIYELIEGAVRRTVPSLPAAVPKGGAFLSTGGLIHYEAPTIRFSIGLLEMATPECRGPVEAARYHHAQDRLLAAILPEVEERLRARGFDGELAISKASSDPHGYVYGSHENYEVDDPPGIWRGLVLLAGFPTFWIPLWTVELLLKAALYSVFLAAAAAYLVCTAVAQIPLLGRPFAAASRGIFRLGRALLREDNLVRVMDLTYVLTVPWIRAYSAFLRFLVLRRARRAVLPHLLARLVYSGPGRVDPVDGRLWLSQKGPSIRDDAGIYWDDARRPVFDLKNFVREPWSVFRRKKRMQVLFSDSSMSRLATVLKLGTTDLILRMAEAGRPLPDMTPRAVREAIAIVSGDASLKAAIPLADGRRMTAIEIERVYLEEARKHFAHDAGGETGEILDKWAYVLDALEEDPHLLYKDADWVAKRDLVAEALRPEGGWRSLRSGGGAATAAVEPVSVAQKVDARYHEIGARGYWKILEDAGQARAYFTDEELEKATREPASSPTARQRGEAVRQHFAGARDGRVSWTHLWLKNPRQKVRFG